MVERERQRHPDPPDAIGHGDRFPGLGNALREGVRYFVLKTHTPFHFGPGGL
jgi:hypothetical protein